MKIEQTEDGVIAIRVTPTINTYCGYALVPTGHPWHGRHYADIDDRIDIHGGVTFAGHLEGDEGWWIGFDCAHFGDHVPALALEGRVWSEQDVRDEARRLARQVVEELSR